MDVIEVKRDEANSPKDVRFGTIYLNGARLGITLEPHRSRRVRPGSYTARLYDSPKFGRTVILLDNVPGRTYIEIHVGNDADDTDGCILVGSTRLGKSISHSVGTLNNIISNLRSTDDIRVFIK